MKIDFHVHTIYSECANLSLRSLVRGYSALRIVPAILDHNSMEGVWALKEDFPDFQFIPGEEILTRSGELAGLFLREPVKSGLSLAKTITAIKRQSGLVYVPHPFDFFRKCVGLRIRVILNAIDLIEVVNGRSLFPLADRFSQKFARTHGIGCAAGSDCHTVHEIANAYTILPDCTKDDLLDALAHARYVVKRSLLPYWFALKERMRKIKIDVLTCIDLNSA